MCEKMATQLNPNEVVSLSEALNMEIIINQALIDLLVIKGIITQEELMHKIEEVRKGLLPAGCSIGLIKAGGSKPLDVLLNL